MQDMNSMAATHTFGTDAMVVITVEYFKEGTVKVRANLTGSGADEMLLAILQGAITAVQNGGVGGMVQ